MAEEDSASEAKTPHRGITIAEKMLLATRPIRNEWTGVRGTCFALDVGERGRRYPFLASNIHITGKMQECSVWFCRNGMPSVRYLIPASSWVPHPSEDLAIAPLEPILRNLRSKGISILLPTIPIRDITTNTEMGGRFDAYEEVLFIGYPQGTHQSGEVPVLRTGITSTPPYLDFEGKSRFLIDASVFPGSSGSPLFILDSSSFSRGMGRGKFWSWPYLAGMVSGYYQAESETSEPGVRYREAVDLGVAIKIREALETARSILRGEGGSGLKGIKSSESTGLILGGTPKKLRSPPELPAGRPPLDGRYLERVSRRRCMRRGTNRPETCGPVRFKQ